MAILAIWCAVCPPETALGVSGTGVHMPSVAGFEEKNRYYRTAVSDAAWERCAPVRDQMLYCDTERVDVYDYVAGQFGALFTGLRQIEVHILAFLTIYEAALSEERQGAALIDDYERARRMLEAAELRLESLTGDGADREDVDIIELNEAGGAVQKQREAVESLECRVAWLSRRQAVFVSALEETLKKIEALDKKTVATADDSGAEGKVDGDG